MTVTAAKFQGLGLITLQPYDDLVDYTFTFDVETAAGANDGAIPSGQTLLASPNGCSVTIYSHPEDVNYSTEIIGTVTNTVSATAPVVTVQMSYPYTTQMRVAAIALATTMEVDSTAGMEDGDRIGIRLDSDAIHWTTIDSITDADTLELSDGIPAAQTVAIDNNVYVPRMVRGPYHMRLICHFSGAVTDKEFDFNRVYVRDI